jgi:hypothetical protein
MILSLQVKIFSEMYEFMQFLKYCLVGYSVDKSSTESSDHREGVLS